MKISPEFKQKIATQVGLASVCWVGGTGDRVFDEPLALEVVDNLVELIETECSPMKIKVVCKFSSCPDFNKIKTVHVLVNDGLIVLPKLICAGCHIEPVRVGAIEK